MHLPDLRTGPKRFGVRCIPMRENFVSDRFVLAGVDGPPLVNVRSDSLEVSAPGLIGALHKIRDRAATPERFLGEDVRVVEGNLDQSSKAMGPAVLVEHPPQRNEE